MTPPLTVDQELAASGVEDHRMLIDGHWVESTGRQWLDVQSPRDRTFIARTPRGQAADADLAVAAAVHAYPAWSRLKPRERADTFRRIADALEPEIERIALLMSLETGNAIRTQTRGETRFAIECLRYFGGLAGEIKGETIPLDNAVLDYSRREPLGVVAAIVPWNAPLMLSAVKIAPALIAGNTMVLKAAEAAPLAMLEFARICQQFLPPGVLNVLTGLGREVGEALTAHPDVAKLTFTGSTGVGRRVMQAGAARLTPVSLELGGKSPQIVFPDANEDWVVDGVISAMRFFRQGQSCTAGSRLFVHEDIVDSFVTKLVHKLRTLRVGDPLDERTDLGSIVNADQFDKVCDYIRDGIAQPGAELALGGLPPTEGPLAQGYYVTPHRVHQRRQQLADRVGGDLRSRRMRDPVERRGRRRRDGQRHPLRTRRVHLDARPRRRPTHRARPRRGLDPDQPRRRAGPRPVLRRLQTQRHRPGVLARGNARQLHPAQTHLGLPAALSSPLAIGQGPGDPPGIAATRARKPRRQAVNGDRPYGRFAIRTAVPARTPAATDNEPHPGKCLDVSAGTPSAGSVMVKVASRAMVGVEIEVVLGLRSFFHGSRRRWSAAAASETRSRPIRRAFRSPVPMRGWWYPSAAAAARRR
jgi:betaine-aldehyde dehydrogenase